jgi:DNA modification methylase
MEIPDNIIECVSLGERILVLDPFVGSGTTVISAINHGCDYIAFDKYQEYVDITNNRIKENENKKGVR